MDIQSLTLSEARAQIQSGELTPQDLTEACLRQIDRLNPELNAFITVTGPQAMSAAAASGRNRHAALEGLPIAVKDLYDTAGVQTTSGTSFFKDNVPSEDAVVVRKLVEAGAVILGKTNTHEIALGLTNINPHFGACRNPWDTRRVSGGSSGGSAVAVASGMALAAVGTDTGGSIRVPAALCGVVGLKPTYGRVSLRGILPLSWTLDHAGPITRSARDAALMLQVMAGYDADDPASVDVPVEDYLTHIDEGIRGWRIALAAGEYIEEAEPDVLASVRAGAQVLSGLGAQVTEVEVDWLHEAALANALIVLSDGAALHRERLASHPDGFGADVRQRLEMGAAYTAGEYALARRQQAQLRRRAESFFHEYDLLLLPTTPIGAPLIEGSDALDQARRLTRFTAPFNLTGLPAISIPCGFIAQTSEVWLPVGLQLVGPHWAEANVLCAAQAFESASDWHTRKPTL
jgi:aspartyl-tRNA(Asn)/glutamyl-tRNA(Gln) amidotransferase subunit A